MSFLDRFKPQPKYRSPDPAIRLAGIAELPDDAESHGVIAELAASDEDVRVRRAAIARLGTAGYLARLARTEKDDGLRRELAERLVEIANAPAETDSDAATALDGLSDQKSFGAVAKSSPHHAVRTAALARIQDQKTLGSVARHAIDPRIALDAVARVTDLGEITAIATNTEGREAGLAALQRLIEATPAEADQRVLLDSLATRAKSKAVAKRARSIIQELDDAQAQRRAEEEELQKRAALAIARVDALGAAPATADAAAQLDEAETAWANLAARVDQPTAERFAERLAAARAAVDAHLKTEAERQAEIERAAARRLAFVSLCERVESLRGDDTPDEIDKARGEWEGMPGASEQELQDAELRQRFDAACRVAAERHANRQDLDRTHARLADDPSPDVPAVRVDPAA